MSNIGFGEITLERVLNQANLKEAYKTVVSNKGAPGVDGMRVDDLLEHIRNHPYELTQSIRDGKYRPSPIRRVYIPKDNGEQRPLGIPTVIDRLVQQSVAQVLSEEYEKVFSENSFGYRPNRGAHDAILKAQWYINNGREWVIDLDLSKFFDTVNHSKLLQLLSDRIKDGRVISLIHKFLKAPISENGKVGKKTTIGTPQGGCISPILANILLNELDQLLDQRGIPFCRYADDMLIMCGSKAAAERILLKVTKFIEEKLFLKVNKEKTKIGRVSTRTQFLGFGFTKRVTKTRRDSNPKGQRWFTTTHQKKRDKFIKSVKEILDRRAPGGIEVTKRKLRWEIQGWVAYFTNSIPLTWRNEVDSWIRRRIRQLYWKQWKKPQKRFEEFNKRWSKAPALGEYAYSSRSYWRMARTHQIHMALSNEVLDEEGWFTIERAMGYLPWINMGVP